MNDLFRHTASDSDEFIVSLKLVILSLYKSIHKDLGTIDYGPMFFNKPLLLTPQNPATTKPFGQLVLTPYEP